MRIAYFSPLNPQPSGIADYSEELLPYLAEGSEITLFVDGFQPTNKNVTQNFKVIDYRAAPSQLNSLPSFDALLYHMGNDHRYHAGIFDTMRLYPGIVVFHDFALQDFFLGLARDRKSPRIYLDELEQCHDSAKRKEAEVAFEKDQPPSMLQARLEYPLNAMLAQAARGIIVHSKWSQARFRRIAPAVPIEQIPMPAKPITFERKNDNPNQIKIASFGLIIPGKGIERILRALAALRSDYDFHYTLVGSENRYFDARSLISTYRMDDRVSITGNVSLEEFERRMVDTDIALNLREQTVGETSASLCRIMAAGVAVIVSNVGSFSELPDDCVIKLDHDAYSDRMLQALLRKLMDDAQLRHRIGNNAKNYVLTEHDIRRSAQRYLNFIGKVIDTKLQRGLINTVSNELRELEAFDANNGLIESVLRDITAITPRQNGAGKTSQPVASKSNETNKTKEPVMASVGRLPKLPDVDYKRAAIEYPTKLDPERHHYLSTKPFYNLLNKPEKHLGEGMDAETFRHFCDFANMAVSLALPAGNKILDVGCGSGWLSEFFARLGYSVTGIDISPELINIASKRVASLQFDVDHETEVRCEFLVHDIEGSPLDATFDAVICYDSLHHFEDERAVIRNISKMTKYGGFVFILEGERPAEGSATETELIDVMHRYHTLESPYSRDYLHELLDESGLAIIGDYLSVNGLFDRATFDNDLQRVQPPDVNYILCKKLVQKTGTRASEVPDSRDQSSLGAHLSVHDLPKTVVAGSRLKFSVVVKNTGTGLWLVGPAERAGSVMIGLKLIDEKGAVVFERHGTPPLPYAIAPGEQVSLAVAVDVPAITGKYTLTIDMVAQHVSWFENAFEAHITVVE